MFVFQLRRQSCILFFWSGQSCILVRTLLCIIIYKWHLDLAVVSYIVELLLDFRGSFSVACAPYTPLVNRDKKEIWIILWPFQDFLGGLTFNLWSIIFCFHFHVLPAFVLTFSCLFRAFALIFVGVQKLNSSPSSIGNWVFPSRFILNLISFFIIIHKKGRQ